MKSKEQIYRFYIDSLVEEGLLPDSSPPPPEAFQSFKDQAEMLLNNVTGKDDIPSSRPVIGNIYTFMVPQTDGCFKVVEFLYTGISSCEHNLVIKVSPFIELANNTHLIGRTDTMNYEYVIETDNFFILSDEEIDNSIYEGSIKNTSLLEEYLCGAQIKYPLQEKKSDKYDKMFIKSEKEQVKEFKQRYPQLIASFEGDKRGDTIPLKEVSQVIDSLSSQFAAVALVAPVFDMGTNSRLMRKSLIFERSPVVAEEFADIYTLKMNSEGAIVIEIDPEHRGKFGILAINKNIVYQGFLWHRFDLGIIQKGIKLSSLKETIRLLIET